MKKSYQESLQSRTKERAYLASLSFGNQFPIPGFYFIKEFGKLHYKDDIYHQMAKVNWKVDRDDPWLEECLFVINLSPLLNYYSTGPKEVNYQSFFNKIISVRKAFYSVSVKDQNSIKSKAVEWEIIEDYTIPDILITENPMIRQIALDEEDAKWNTLAALNDIVDSGFDEIPEEDDLLIYEDEFEEIPDDGDQITETSKRIEGTNSARGIIE